MSEIKRYIPAAGVLEDERIIYMRDNDKGEWVRHTDHLAALKQAKIDAVRLLDAALCPCCDKSGAYYDNYGQVQQCQWCYEVEQLKEQGE